ncbi:unnamed protein product [Triticum turgidum subsp. durum]|uniref:F-box domain-containing protein n=1 Tax=Triticum turgidum subsp. durum TaxID=4567 RepID=A0A9R1QVZ1_TRITD|nr:unnamed protein product [Triticum turgidum subsp. durum]
MVGPDRLSDLPDDLLLRILHYAPAKEAASTVALSRRWRSPLWCSSGAVNLETVVEEYVPRGWGYEDKREEFDEALFLSRRDAFVSAAEAALDAADVPITRLTLRFNFMGSYGYSVVKFLHYDRDESRPPDRGGSRSPDPEGSRSPDRDGSRSPDPEGSRSSDDESDDRDWSSDEEGSLSPDQDRSVSPDRDWSQPPDPDVLGKLLSHETVHRVEELRFVANECRCDMYAYDDDDKISSSSGSEGILSLSLYSLPSVALRVLELTGCNNFVTLLRAARLAFPWLQSLRLRHCTVQVDALQSLIDAAAVLTAVHFEFVMIEQLNNEMTLRCPTATLIVLKGCNWKENDNPWWVHNKPEEPMVIDAPRLRRFRYKGLLRPFSLSPQPLDLAQGDLHFVLRRGRDGKEVWCHNGEGPRRGELDLEVFWQFLQSFSTAKDLKLRLNALEHIAVLSKPMRLKLLPTFRCLERLELHGLHRPQGMTAAVAVANLLRSCPVLRDLRINLTLACHDQVYRSCERRFQRRKFRSDRDKSIHLVNCSRNSPNTYYDDTRCGEASEIPALSRCSFNCLQSTMKRVGLQFRLDDVNCFGVKLVKFFAENAMVLEEMCIDGGNEKLGEHMTRKVERWICNSSIKRKPGASSFVVVPIRR